jgi:hypothetical protein
LEKDDLICTAHAHNNSYGKWRAKVLTKIFILLLRSVTVDRKDFKTATCHSRALVARRTAQNNDFSTTTNFVSKDNYSMTFSPRQINCTRSEFFLRFDKGEIRKSILIKLYNSTTGQRTSPWIMANRVNENIYLAIRFGSRWIKTFFKNRHLL